MTEDDIIEEIITSFKELAIGDIEFNIERPISAFILCSCLIDQLAAFRYNHGNTENKEYYNQFIKDYLPQYRGLNLYINLRCKLVHNYTVGKHIRITSEETIFENIGKGKNVNLINAKLLFKDLKIVFDKLCSEFRDKTSIIRENAIKCYLTDNSRIIMQSKTIYTTFLDYECDILIKYYKKILLGKYIQDEKHLRINSISKINLQSNSFLIVVKSTYANHDYSCQVDDVLKILNMPTSKETLKNLNQSQDSNLPRADTQD